MAMADSNRMEATIDDVWLMVKWCQDNLGYIPVIKHCEQSKAYRIEFRSDADAVAFKLTNYK